LFVAFEELEALRAEVWGAAPWERIAADAAEIHDDLVGRLGRPGW